MDSFYIRQPFQDVFLAVFELFCKQKQDKFQKNSFTCYRACIISDEEFKRFQNNIGGFVEMEGFLSTSYDLGAALAFYSGEKNALLEIEVNVDELEGELNWGFANIEDCSSHEGEK